MQSKTLHLNIVTADPALGIAFTYPWVGVDSIQKEALTF